MDARAEGSIVEGPIIVEELVDTAFEGWEGGDVDVDVVAEKKFVREGEDDIRLAVLAVGQEEDLLHLECSMQGNCYML